MSEMPDMDVRITDMGDIEDCEIPFVRATDPDPEWAAALEKGRLAFFGEEDQCFYCGAPEAKHGFVTGKHMTTKQVDVFQVVRLPDDLTEGGPLVGQQVCWSRDQMPAKRPFCCILQGLCAEGNRKYDPPNC